MTASRKERTVKKAFALVLTVSLMWVASSQAETIYDIQYSTPPDYISPLEGQTVDVTGGIVTKVRVGYRTRIIIQDPTLGTEWAGIMISCDSGVTAPAVVRGDQVDFFDVIVEEYRGNTQLYYDAGSSYTVNSSGHAVAPFVVLTSDIPVPVDHGLSEKWEHMLLTVENVTVGAMDLGKADDNYELNNADGTCWASDFANIDLPPGTLYYVSPGGCYASITGYLEQYTKLEDGWDYYQLLPRDAQDYVLGASAVEAASWSGVKSMFK
jgi:hypothetical protein